MSRDRGPVLKRARALGIEPQYLGVNKKSKRHGAVRRRKKSEYGIQLGEAEGKIHLRTQRDSVPQPV